MKCFINPFTSTLLLILATFVFLCDAVQAQDAKPNILVIWGDDIGTWNISHNNANYSFLGTCKAC